MNKFRRGDVVRVYGFVKTIPAPHNDNAEFYFSYGNPGKVLDVEEDIVNLSMDHGPGLVGGLAKAHPSQCDASPRAQLVALVDSALETVDYTRNMEIRGLDSFDRQLLEDSFTKITDVLKNVRERAMNFNS